MITWGSSAARDVEFLHSVDGSSWKAIPVDMEKRKFRPDGQGTDLLEFPAETIRYFRINAKSRVTRSGCSGSAPLQMGCPGSQADTLHQGTDTAVPMRSAPASRLMQWPVQIKLLPVQAPFYQGARLLIAADCTAFSRADFHERFMKGRITLIGCPKLDEGDYTEKLTEIIRCNDIREVTIVRMEVPCCGGLQRAAETALRESGKFLPWQVVTLGRDGTIQE